MKKEDFVKLGVDEETAAKLETASQDELKGYIPKARFDEVNNEKKKLELDVRDRDGQLETLKNSTGDVEGMKKQIEELQKANKDLDKAELADDGTIKGLAEQITALQKSDSYLFNTKESKQTQVKGAKPGESGNDDGNGVDTSKMTYSELAVRTLQAATPQPTSRALWLPLEWTAGQSVRSARTSPPMMGTMGLSVPPR